MTDKELPATVRAALEGGEVLVIRRTYREARDVMDGDLRLLRDLGIAGEMRTVTSPLRMTFPGGGRITYMSASGAEERVRGMQFDMIDDAGWLDAQTRWWIQKRPVPSTEVTS